MRWSSTGKIKKTKDTEEEEDKDKYVNKYNVKMTKIVLMIILVFTRRIIVSEGQSNGSSSENYCESPTEPL